GIQSIPTNADNQDVVTMGTIAARQSAAVVDLLYELLAIESLVLAQAMDFADGEAFSTAGCALRRFVRCHSAPLVEDRPLSEEIATLAAAMRAGTPGHALPASALW
ncbi:MAG: aromatic amino acid lyase, partial [Halorhodospira sp.]